ncbi:MAG: sel1 repeat family protein [Ruminococcaceae bacterium]|nr:sel1 repeat family protein [Oscillospiraceae bacterium]
MWFIIILIVVVIVVKVKKTVDKAKNEQLDRERIEKKKKAQTEAKARFEVITDAEKQKLLACGEDVLSTTLNAFNKAIKGDADAMLFMAITYQAKIQNAKKSAYWMQKSSDAGSSDSKYWLGEFYVSGYGVPQDRVKGVSLIMDAAREGNKKAIQSLKENGMSVAEMRSVGIPV